MTIKQSHHVDRERRDIACDEAGCQRKQLLPADTSLWTEFIERIGWRLHAEGGTCTCPFCAGLVKEKVCECPTRYRGTMMFEVKRASATDTRFVCTHCGYWIGTHDADPPRTR